MITNDDGTFLVIYSLLKIKIKQVYLKISLKFLEICSKQVFFEYSEFAVVLKLLKPQKKSRWQKSADVMQ